MTYSWSGCATGAAKAATCSVNALSSFTATVTVSDGHAHTSQASVAVAGINNPPTISNCHPFSNPMTAKAGGQFDFKGGDPDGDPWTATLGVTGTCKTNTHECDESRGFCNLQTLSAGECNGTITIKDPWNATVSCTSSADVQ